MQQSKLIKSKRSVFAQNARTGLFFRDFGFVAVSWMLAVFPFVSEVGAANLLADEQGPTAPEAVATVTANEDFLLPSYVAPSAPETQTTRVPSEVDILNEIFGSPDPVGTATQQVAATAVPAQHTFSPRTGVENTEETPLLTPLTPLPIIRTEATIPQKQRAFKQAGFADQALAMATTPADGLGIPREIRITFYPSQSTFSAQALKWVKAFALHVVNDPRLWAEIRVSEQNWNTQKKRLSVLLQILKETGVSAHQIRVYKTARDQNSILMGYAYNPEYVMTGNGKFLGEREQKTIDW